MELSSGEVTLRMLRKTDADQLAQLITPSIWDNLRDHIPFPYHTSDALNFISTCEKQSPPCTFAITIKKELCGVIGIILQKDIYRLSGEVGYWIGESFWGKGIATTALQLISNYGFNELKLNRLFAGTFGHNEASKRVLEKCGYLLEGISKAAIIKNNQILDEHRYALLASGYSL